MSILSIKSGIIVLLAFAGLPLFVSCSQEPRQAEYNSEDVTNPGKDASSQTAKDVEKYWTEERMRNAKPMPFPEAIMPEDSWTGVLRENMPADARPGSSPGRVPDGDRQPESKN